MVNAFVNWFRRSWFTYGYEGEGTAPLEAIAWRLFGVVVLVAFVVITFADPSRTRRWKAAALAVLASFVALVGLRDRGSSGAHATCRPASGSWP